MPDKNKGLSATGVMAKFLKDDPNPPAMPEMKEFIQSMGMDEKHHLVLGVPGVIVHDDGSFGLPPE